jgi:enamine deaminase RidA (YjgF/YER057c/UK114 family)
MRLSTYWLTRVGDGRRLVLCHRCGLRLVRRPEAARARHGRAGPAGWPAQPDDRQRCRDRRQRPDVQDERFRAVGAEHRGAGRQRGALHRDRGLPGGTLPPGVTITEAQGINARRIGENLQAAGLSYQDVYTMRVFVQNPAGAQAADFAGWNRAYRQYFANIDLTTGKPVPVPLGSAEPAAPFVVNKARTSRFALEIENLPVAGWLVEVEVDTAYPTAPGK